MQMVHSKIIRATVRSGPLNKRHDVPWTAIDSPEIVNVYKPLFPASLPKVVANVSPMAGGHQVPVS